MKNILAIIGGAGALVILVGLALAHPVAGPGTGRWGWMGPGMMGE